MAQEKKNPISGLIPFTLTVAGLSLALFLYLYVTREPVPETDNLRKEIAEGFGVTGFWVLAVIYGRSILKLTLNEGTLLQRFIPVEFHDISHSWGRKILTFLNRTHRYVGAAALIIFACHALLMGTARWNPFLVMVLGLLVWQGLFGVLLVLRIPLSSLKKYGYLVHAQLFTGVMITIFAAFGHLLV